MTLAFFKFGLPVLLGYTLFSAVSGRWNPIAWPAHKEERASWLLGMWIGLVVSLTVALAIARASTMPASEVQTLLAPALVLVIALIVPALVMFAYCRHRWARQSTHKESEITQKIEPEVNVPDETPAKIVESPDLSSVGKQEVDLPIMDKPEVVATDLERDNAEMLEQLATETALRETTEKHLRITRKALSRLEAETRHFSIDKADSIIALEEKLAQTIEDSTKHESGAIREKVRRMELEQNVTELKQKIVKAKQEIRRGAAARARALSTANKSIAFARQCVQVREQHESKLKEAKTAIEMRQKTINGLLEDLEKQKRRTQHEVSSMAKQLVLHEKQLKARRSLEQVARSVENKLTSRLVKKVAKAKPLAPGLNEGETG